MKKVMLSCVFAMLACGVYAQDITSVPRAETTIAADQIWIVKNGTIVKKVAIQAAPALRIYGPRGGYITFCPPGVCPPQTPSPNPSPSDPPQFDFPDDSPKEEAEVVETADTSGNDVGLATFAAVLAGAAGAFVGYRNMKVDPDLHAEAEAADKAKEKEVSTVTESN